MVAGGAILFGVNGNISTLLFNDGVTPLTLISFRMLIGGLCLLTVMLFWQRSALKAPRQVHVPKVICPALSTNSHARRAARNRLFR